MYPDDDRVDDADVIADLELRIVKLEAFVRRVAEGEHVEELPEEARALLTKGKVDR